MRRNGSITPFTIALVLACGVTVARAQEKAPETRVRELITEAAARIAKGEPVGAQSPGTAQPPGTPQPPGTAQQPGTAQPATPPAFQLPPTPAMVTIPPDTRPVVRMTLDDSVAAALDHNLDITVQRLNPEINDIAIASVRSTYHPLATSTLSGQSATNPANTTLAGSFTPGAPIVVGTSTWNGGITQNVPWGGGNFNVSINNTRQTTTSQNTLYSPSYNPNWSGVYTQPLLRNFGIDSTRRTIQVTKLNRDVSDVQLRATITNTLSNVRNAYWNYVFAVQSAEVAQQSVDLADQLVKDNQTRLEVGTMAPIDVITAQAQAAAARQTLVTDQGTIRTAELALKQLIVGGTQDPLWASRIDPVDRPEFRPEAIDIEAAVRRALSQRSDLAIAKLDVRENDTTLKFLRDQLKPQMDFVGTYGLVGLGGTQLEKSSTNVNASVIGTIPGGYGDALSSLFRNSYPHWTAQVNISYPLGLSSQQASVARARVQLNQVQAQLKQIELQVATDVTNAAISVQSATQQVQAAQVARELAQQTMLAEQAKFEVGMSTNYNVVLTQRDLATAQNNELQATLNYRHALVELERLQQTTLTNLNITVLSPTAPGVITVAQ